MSHQFGFDFGISLHHSHVGREDLGQSPDLDVRQWVLFESFIVDVDC